MHLLNFCSSARVILAALLLSPTLLASQQFAPWPFVPWPANLTEPVYQQIVPGQRAFPGQKESLVVDVTGDGIGDIVTSTSTLGNTSSFTVYPGLGTGLFGFPIVHPAGPIQWQPIGAIDIDNDGDTDILGSNALGPGPSALCVLLNDGSGFFVVSGIASTLSGVGPQALWVDSGDLTGDGVPEAVVRDFDAFGTYTRIFTLAGGGWTELLRVQDSVAPLSSPMPRIGDVDGDGWNDVVLFPTGGLTDIRVLRHLGTPAALAFSDSGPIAFGPSSWAALEDVDGDGTADAVGLVTPLSACAPSIICALGSLGSGLGPSVVTQTPLGNGPPLGNAPIPMPCSPLQHQLQVRDLNGDGRRDVFIHESFGWYPALMGRPQRIRIHVNVGGAQFSPAGIALHYGPTDSVGLAVLDDQDEDGDLDIIVGSDRWQTPSNSTDIGVMYNRQTLGQGTSGATGTPILSHGIPTTGNAAFSVVLSNALAGQPCVLGVSSASGYVGAGPGGIWIDLSQLILPSLSGLGSSVTDANGVASIAMPIPLVASARGLAFHAQWAVSDPAGAAFSLPAPANLSLSQATQVMIWF